MNDKTRALNLGETLLKNVFLPQTSFQMEFLDQYQKIVADAIEKHTFTNKPDELYQPMNYIISHGGKRLRPIMLLMACDLFKGDLEKALKPSLAIEFFHNFTLIHDDIMDEAPLRRNKPTIHTLHGINVGILSGDALLIMKKNASGKVGQVVDKLKEENKSELI